MTKRNLIFALGVIASAVGTSQAGDPVVVAQRITIVPFAVPVAVPVAVVQRPTLFYSVGAAGGAAVVESPAAPPKLALSAQDGPSLREQAAAILKRHCAECHQGSQARGEIALFDDAGRLPLQLPRQFLVDVTESTPEQAPAMPPTGREKLNVEDWRILKQWARLPKSFVY